MAINIRKVDAFILEGEPYHAWGTKYNKFIRFNIGSVVFWYILDDINRIITNMLPEQGNLERLFQESNGFFEQLELF